MRDIANNLGVAASLVPVVQTATLAGTAVDLLGYGSAMLIVNTGAIAGSGVYSIALQESDTTTDGDFADADADDLIGSLPTELAASTVYKQGYIGNKRYVRAKITKGSGTSIAAGAVFVRGNAQDRPVT
jgi:hypothetical protein